MDDGSRNSNTEKDTAPDKNLEQGVATASERKYMLLKPMKN